MDPKTHPLNGITNATGIAPPRGYALSGKVMLAAIVVLFSVVLLILFLHLYVRYHVYRRQQRRQRRRQRLIFSSSVDHAPSKGLDSAVLNSLSVLIFSPDDGVTDDEDATECAVCLSEFVDGEKVRVLPRCDHHFHVDCIDMWFCSHSNCPLCRSPVEIEAVTSPVKNSTPCGDPAIEIGSGSSSDSDRDPDPIRVDNSSVEVQLGLWSWILAVRKFFLRESRPIPDLERGEAAAPAVE